MRRLFSVVLMLGLLVALFPGRVQARVSFGPTREMIILSDREHLEGDWPFYLDLEGHRFVRSPADGDVWLKHDPADGVLALMAAVSGGGTGVRGVAAAAQTFGSAVDPPSSWDVGVRLAAGRTFWIRTRSGRVAKMEVLAFLEPAFSSGALVRYALEDDMAPVGAAETGTAAASFARPTRVTLPNINRQLVYLDVESGALVEDPGAGELVYAPPNLLHLDNDGPGLQRLPSEPGFARTATYYRSGWEHSIPVEPSSSLLFRSSSGQLHKLHVVAADTAQVMLELAPTGSPEEAYPHMNPGLLAAYTVVLFKDASGALPLDLVGELPAATPANHVTVTAAGFAAGPRSTAIVRTTDLADLGVRQSAAGTSVPAEPNILAIAYSTEGLLERVRWVISSANPYRLGVHLLPVVAYPPGDAEVLVRTPIVRPGAGITQIGGYDLGSLHVTAPDQAELLPSGGIVLPGGAGPLGPIGYFGGTLFLAGQGTEKGYFRVPAFGAFIDPEIALRQPGEYPPDLFFDGQNIMRGQGATRMYKLGDVAVESVPPGATGEAVYAVPAHTPQTLLVERADGKAALVRIDSSGRLNDSPWVTLRIFFQPDGSRVFWRQAAPAPSSRVIKLRIGSNVAYIDGRPTTLESAPQLINNTTMVPLRFVAEALGASVSFDAPTKVIHITLDATQVTMQVNNPVATVNGRQMTLQVPPTVVNSRTLVPIRFVSEGLGARVGWDNATKTVTITR